MPRRSAPRRAAAKVGRTITDVATIPRRLDERVRPAAQVLGWIGIAALAGCAWLAAAPAESWPEGLDRARLPVYGTVALVAASLLGWAFMQEGQARIERRLGRRLSLAVFVFLPIAAAAAGWIDDRADLDPRTRAEWATAFRVARWVSPALVLASLWAFFASKAVRRSGLRVAQAVGYGLLLLPFVALVAALVLGFRLPWIDEPLHETLSALGGGALALQIVLAWFVGGTG